MTLSFGNLRESYAALSSSARLQFCVAAMKARTLLRTASNTDNAHTPDAGQSSDDRRSRISPVHQPPIHSWAWRRDKFLFRHPKLHKSWLELCSCYHHIRLLYSTDHILLVSMGKGWIQQSAQHLEPNKTTQGRKQGIEKLLSLRPWASPEDIRFYLY